MPRVAASLPCHWTVPALQKQESCGSRCIENSSEAASAQVIVRNAMLGPGYLGLAYG